MHEWIRVSEGANSVSIWHVGRVAHQAAREPEGQWEANAIVPPDTHVKKILILFIGRRASLCAARHQPMPRWTPTRRTGGRTSLEAGLRLVHAFAFGRLSAAECGLINFIFVGINQLRERYLLLKFSQQKLSVGFENIFR